MLQDCNSTMDHYIHTILVNVNVWNINILRIFLKIYDVVLKCFKDKQDFNSILMSLVQNQILYVSEENES